MIYVLTIGEYSDLAVSRVVEGKPGLDIPKLVKDWIESKFGLKTKGDKTNWERYFIQLGEWREQFDNEKR